MAPSKIEGVMCVEPSAIISDEVYDDEVIHSNVMRTIRQHNVAFSNYNHIEARGRGRTTRNGPARAVYVNGDRSCT